MTTGIWATTGTGIMEDDLQESDVLSERALLGVSNVKFVDLSLGDFLTHEVT